MDLTAIIIAIVGVLSNVVTYFLSKKKYKSEVNTNEIENLKRSLEFYERIVQDNDKQLRFYINMAEENRIEVFRVKSIIYQMINNSCLHSVCKDRKPYTEEQIREILGEVKYPEQDGTKD